jgi:hypothetical protein
VCFFHFSPKSWLKFRDRERSQACTIKSQATNIERGADKMSNQPTIVLNNGMEVGVDTIQEWSTHLGNLLEDGVEFDLREVPNSEAFISLFKDLHDAIASPKQMLPSHLLPQRPYHVSAR